jgi:hypothetical protein
MVQLSAGGRRVVVVMQVSLDGFFQGPGGDIGRHRVDESCSTT